MIDNTTSGDLSWLMLKKLPTNEIYVFHYDTRLPRVHKRLAMAAYKWMRDDELSFNLDDFMITINKLLQLKDPTDADKIG